MANIGYVGLGTMGGQMANRFLEKGHNVTGYNRTRSKAEWLIDKGLKFADSPRAVAASTDVVLSMVTNTQALTQIAEGPDGIIEGLEGTASDHFVLAVQWHPERSIEDDGVSRAIFRAFVKAAHARRPKLVGTV